MTTCKSIARRAGTAALAVAFAASMVPAAALVAPEKAYAATVSRLSVTAPISLTFGGAEGYDVAKPAPAAYDTAAFSNSSDVDVAVLYLECTDYNKGKFTNSADGSTMTVSDMDDAQKTAYEADGTLPAGWTVKAPAFGTALTQTSTTALYDQKLFSVYASGNTDADKVVSFGLNDGSAWVAGTTSAEGAFTPGTATAANNTLTYEQLVKKGTEPLTDRFKIKVPAGSSRELTFRLNLSNTNEVPDGNVSAKVNDLSQPTTGAVGDWTGIAKVKYTFGEATVDNYVSLVEADKGVTDFYLYDLENLQYYTLDQVVDDANALPGKTAGDPLYDRYYRYATERQLDYYELQPWMTRLSTCRYVCKVQHPSDPSNLVPLRILGVNQDWTYTTESVEDENNPGQHVDQTTYSQAGLTFWYAGKPSICTASTWGANDKDWESYADVLAANKKFPLSNWLPSSVASAVKPVAKNCAVKESTQTNSDPWSYATTLVPQDTLVALSVMELLPSINNSNSALEGLGKPGSGSYTASYQYCAANYDASLGERALDYLCLADHLQGNGYAVTRTHDNNLRPHNPDNKHYSMMIALRQMELENGKWVKTGQVGGIQSVGAGDINFAWYLAFSL